MLESLLERFRQHDRVALARLITLVAHGDHLDEITTAIGPSPKRARVIAVTGSGGVGKSTLVGRLIEMLRAGGKTVAVLACDPQSPISGGALLGDRFRMPSRPDDGLFIRSLAAVSGQGTVARHLDVMLRMLDAFGFDVILVETVGAGQGDTAIRDLADTVVLLLQPETGDDLQWEKAGLLEVADVVAIHKADLPGADRAEGQVRAALDLAGGRSAVVLRVSAKTGDGVERLLAAIESCPLRTAADFTDEHLLLRAAQENLTSWFARTAAAGDPQLKELVSQWQKHAVSDTAAVRRLFELAASHSD